MDCWQRNFSSVKDKLATKRTNRPTMHTERSYFFLLLMLASLVSTASAFTSVHHLLKSSGNGSRLLQSTIYNFATLELENETNFDTLKSGEPQSTSDLDLVEKPVHNFDSLQECLSFLEGIPETHDESLVVVKFYASYCRICKRASITYKKIASDDAYAKNFHFTRVEAGRMSAERLRTLGLTKFPFIQIFRKGMCVGKSKTSKNKVGLSENFHG